MSTHLIASNECFNGLFEYKDIEKLSKKNDENKENVENVMNVWNAIGLRIEKREDVFTVRFNKISETDPNKWFTVKVNAEDKRIKGLLLRHHSMF